MSAVRTAAQVEGEIVARDAWILRRAMEANRQERGGGVISLALSPFISFYLVELHEWFRRGSAGPLAGMLGPYDAEFRDMRASLKIFDTNRGGLGEITRRLKAVQTASVTAFNHHHRGLLGPFKRALQDDLGLYFLGADLVCTTHMGAFGPSLAPDSSLTGTPRPEPNSTKSFAFGEYCGRLLGAVTRATGDQFATAWTRSAAVDGEILWCEDHKSGRFYPALDGQLGAGDGLAAPVTFMASHVNFVHLWLRNLLPESHVAFRFRFLVAFHALRALKILGAAARTRAGSLGAMIARASSSSAARRLRRMDRLRDVVAHYNMTGASPAQLAASDPFYALVEDRSKHSIDELGVLVDDVLASLSAEFRGIIRLTRRARVLKAPWPPTEVRGANG